MKHIAVLLLAVAMGSGVVIAQAQTSTPTQEPPAKLIVDSPLPDLLAKGIVWITWGVENVNISPGVRQGCPQRISTGWTSPHNVDDLPWLWAHMSAAPIDVALLPPGPHKIRIELVNAIHQNVPEQSKTVTFTIPDGARPH